MKRNVAKLWIKALTSGKYRQTEGTLKKPLNEKQCGYCCLGVLCDLYIKETGDGKWERDGSERIFVDELGERDTGGLTKKVMEWAGIKGSSGKLLNPLPYKKKTDYGEVDNKAYSLVELNDDAKFKFKQIAEVIKTNQEYL